MHWSKTNRHHYQGIEKKKRPVRTSNHVHRRRHGRRRHFREHPMSFSPQRAQSSTEDSGINQITGGIITAAMKVHSVLGPGLLEKAYNVCLAHELRKNGFKVETEVKLPVIY